jgi:hypothetical protein
MLALVLPALLGLVPRPAISAAAALERDIALSVCGPFGTDDPAGQEQHPARHDACILCVACAAASGPAPGDAAAAFPVVPRTATSGPHPVAAGFRPLPSLLLFGNPPRGPPTSLQV